MKYSLRSLMPKRSWFQFSLKTLLVGMTVLCIGPGGYVAYEQSKARRQKAAVEAIEKLGGHVYFDDNLHPRSTTMRQILGDERFGNVKHVVMEDLGSRAVGSGLSEVAKFDAVTTLSLWRSKVTDSELKQVTVLEHLESLMLDNTQVTDEGLVQFTALKNLESLSLENTQVTDAGVSALRKALPNCRITKTAYE